MKADTLDKFWTNLVENTSPTAMFSVMNRFESGVVLDSRHIQEEVFLSKKLENSKKQATNFSKLRPELIKTYKNDVRINRKPLLSTSERLSLSQHIFPESNFQPFSMTEIIHAFAALKSAASPGCDLIKKSLLATNSCVFLESFWCAINNCMLRGGFPEAWKKAKLTFCVKPSKTEKNNSVCKRFSPNFNYFLPSKSG